MPQLKAVEAAVHADPVNRMIAQGKGDLDRSGLAPLSAPLSGPDGA